MLESKIKNYWDFVFKYSQLFLSAAFATVFCLLIVINESTNCPYMNAIMLYMSLSLSVYIIYELIVHVAASNDFITGRNKRFLTITWLLQLGFICFFGGYAFFYMAEWILNILF